MATKGNEIMKLTENTLIPISLAGFIAMGSFFLSDSLATVQDNKDNIQKNADKIDRLEETTNKNYIEIIQRLSRIEEAVKK